MTVLTYIVLALMVVVFALLAPFVIAPLYNAYIKWIDWVYDLRHK